MHPALYPVSKEVFYRVCAEMCAEDANPTPTPEELQEAALALVAIGHGMVVGAQHYASAEYLRRAGC